jgi:hypothetical protein
MAEKVVMLNVLPRWFSFSLAIALLLSIIVFSKATSAADDTLEQGFANPPATAKPTVYWWWLFNRVDKKGITRDLEQFKAKGIGGVNLICTGGYAGDGAMPGVKFLGAEWRELFRHAVKEANRLELDLGFNMAGGWVMMGPWVAQQDAMKKVVQSELKLKGLQRFSGALPQPDTVDGYYRDVMVQAYPTRDKAKPIDPKEIIDITGGWRADRNFQWDVPEGEWTILRTGYTLTGSKWEPYPMGDTFPGGAGYQIDCLNAASLDTYFDYLGAIALGEAKKAGGRLGYLWCDSWESGKLTWTEDFASQFRKFRGYDLTPYLPALHGCTVVNAEVTSRFRADFDRTIADCVTENFYARFAQLCHDNGVRMGSEAAGPGDNPPIDSLRNLGRCDVPAGEFWVSGHFDAPGGYNSHPGARGNLKQTGSAAHIYGKRIAQAEAFTQQEGHRTHWSHCPSDLKPYGDNAYCEGINYFMLHQATCHLSTDGLPGYEFCAGQHFTPSITWWEQSGAFFSYLARCQYLLQQGLFVGDVCYYLGEDPPVVAPYKQYAFDLRGYDGDYCNAEVLLTRMSVKNGRIVLPDGMSYRVLVLQNCTSTSREVCDIIGGSVQQKMSSTPSTAMSLEVLLKIGQLVHDGATVVGPRPEKAAGLNDYPQCDRRVKTLAAHIWGDCDGKTHTEHAYGKGRVIWGKSVGDVLRADRVGPDFTYAQLTEKPAASWIWHNADGDEPPTGKRTFKREISIPQNRRIVAASIRLTADNEFELQINGTTVCRGNDWSKVADHDPTKYLVAGSNPLLIHATNTAPGPAGLLVIGSITLDNGETISLDSRRGTWLSSTDGEKWSAVRSVCRYGDKPWGDVANLHAATLDYIHRAVGDADIYFVSNRTNRPVTQDCVFRITGRQPEIWEPVSGTIRDATAFQQVNAATALPLAFAPFESYFIVFRKPIAANAVGSSLRNFPALSTAQTLAGPWTVQFDPRWGGPASVEFPELVSWTTRSENGIKFYSGKATYRKTFDIDQKVKVEGRDAGRLFLDLGGVKNVAEVRLNGKNLGVLWTAPWRVEITDAVRPSGNVLEIDVVNLWVNRVVGDLSLPKEKRLTETHDVFRFGMLQPTTPLLDSGLLGPVTLQREATEPRLRGGHDSAMIRP